MRKTFTRLLLIFFCFSVSLASAQINGETNIVAGGTYAYSYAGGSCNGYPNYNWNVTGGVITSDDYYGNITR